MAEAYSEAVLLQRICLGEQCHACFSSAPTAIGDIAIAAKGAAQTPAGSKGGAPMDATSKARKADSTTATASGITGGGAVKDRPA